MTQAWTLHAGDALTVLRTLPAASVSCVVTSPPYWGLRDYGTATWDGGDADCGHIERNAPKRDSPGGFHNSRNDRSGTTQPNTQSTVLPYRTICGDCGATRIDAQIGLEPSPAAYVAALVAVFAEVRRVLREDGVCWCNLGDSYSSQAGPQVAQSKWLVTGASDGQNGGKSRAPVDGLKPKDLCGIPWRVAFALQADGWYLRSDVIWAKPNPMPESVTDRPTKAHEYVFLLTRSERYAYDADAIKVLSERAGEIHGTGPNALSRHSAKGLGVAPSGNALDGGFGISPLMANARTVWSLATEASDYDHFAVMPKALARRCILAGCPMGGTVLDPFAGVCTTGVVALEEGRSFIGIELSPTYHALGRARLADTMPLFASEVSA